IAQMRDDLLMGHLLRAGRVEVLEPTRPVLAGLGFDRFVTHARFEIIFACHFFFGRLSDHRDTKALSEKEIAFWLRGLVVEVLRIAIIRDAQPTLHFVIDIFQRSYFESM